MLLALSLVWGPSAALAATAPALLLANLHRLFLFRKDLDRRVAVAFAAGALPGSFVGGLFAARVPEAVLAWLLCAMTGLAILRALGLVAFRAPRAALAPAGLGVGVLTGASGGAGVLLAPLLLSFGLTGARYIASASLAAVAMHVGRVVAYGAGGLITRETLLRTAILAIALFAGNLAGRALRRRLLDAPPARPTDSGAGPQRRSNARASRLELATLIACVALSLAGVGK